MSRLEERLERAKQLRSEFHADLREQMEQCQPLFPKRTRESDSQSSEQYLLDAKEIYRDIQEQLGNIISSLDENHSEMELHQFQRNFDIMLQTALLQIAVGDDDFSHSERQFIREIAENGDVVEWINAHYPNKREALSWGKLFYLEEDELDDLICYLSHNSLELMKNVFYPTALADLETEIPYQELIMDEITDICNCFTYVDGDGCDADEKNAMRQAIDLYFRKPISVAHEELTRVLEKEHPRKA